MVECPKFGHPARQHWTQMFINIYIFKDKWKKRFLIAKMFFSIGQWTPCTYILNCIVIHRLYTYHLLPLNYTLSMSILFLWFSFILRTKRSTYTEWSFLRKFRGWISLFFFSRNIEKKERHYVFFPEKFRKTSKTNRIFFVKM